MDISTVRHELAAIADGLGLADEPKLTGLGFTPDAVPEPCFYSGEVSINPNMVFGGAYDITVTCRLLVGRQDDEFSQRALDKFLSQTGDQSVVAAFRAARATGRAAGDVLSGAADDFAITGIDGYRLYQVGEVQFYGAEFKIRVIGS